jgi:hypothetical protein
MVSEIRAEKNGGVVVGGGKLGRPKGPGKILLENPRQSLAFAFLNEAWGPYNSEPCPVASQYDLVINVPSVSFIYQEYAMFWQYTTDALCGSKPLSLTSFKEVWETWKIEKRVRERQKKNVSGKCDGEYSRAKLN